MNRLFVLAAPMAVIAQPAYAGEEVLFADPPAWVEPVDIEAAISEGEDIVLYDRQVRLEGGIVSGYTDVAYEIRNTQALQERGTLQFAWLPDKGDLIVHRLHLIRDGEVIDLVAQGLKPEILRRERELESRSVDGMLTAAFTIPGMEVGDVIRMSTSTTLRDQALQNEMQESEGLVAEPVKLGFGRLRVSWPEDSEINWGSMGQVDPPEVMSIDGDSVLEIALPIEKTKEMPEDAPARFKVTPTLQFGTFDSWKDVSAVMAPHFVADGAIKPGSEMAVEVERIMAASTDAKKRAALALQLVQDEISYLANGMDGGNYLPQSPQETWDKKFGDCKAKSLLLLAFLREMGIEAEVVLVDSEFGDAVSISQPVPSAFDHMIVRAMVGGEDFWLDGTGAGARYETIDEVPNFSWALPLTEAGAELVWMEQRWPQYPDETISITFDMSGGVDLPAPYEVVVEARGPIGADMRPQATETDIKTLIGAANQKLGKIYPGLVYNASYSYDEESGVARMKAKGFAWETFSIKRNIATHAISSATTNWEFKPDRARSAWREIPYKVGGPYTEAREITMLLPDEGSGAEIDGEANLEETAAGIRFNRSSTLEGGAFRLSDRTSYVPAEIAPEEISAARSAVRRIASGDPKVRIENPTRYWELEDEVISAKVAPVVSGMDTLVAEFDDNAQMLLLRGLMHTIGRSYDAAHSDLEAALELEESSETHLALASVQMIQGNMDHALLNAQIAFDLKGDIDTADQYTQLLALAGQADEALDILDSLGLSGEEAMDVAADWASLSGHAGREDEAWSRIADMLEDRPDSVALNNAKCWMAGIWNYNIENALEYCEEAVSLSRQAAWVIDSRAMLKFRLGRIDEALADIETVLEKDPSNASSRYLRGLIKLQQGDNSGRIDIVHAKRIEPAIVQQFSAYGLNP